MELTDAIYGRRAVRSYSDRKVERATVNTLIDAAIQAPSAMNKQPWAFAVIQDIALLKTISDQVKAHILQTLPYQENRDEIVYRMTNPDFHIFYQASTLLIVCAKPEAEWNAMEDCCLAAENLMLAAYAHGLATCPIGFARSWLNLPQSKQELGIPADYAPVMPIIVGYPQEMPPHVPRNAPEIVCWK